MISHNCSANLAILVQSDVPRLRNRHHRQNWRGSESYRQLSPSLQVISGRPWEGPAGREFWVQIFQTSLRYFSVLETMRCEAKELRKREELMPRSAFSACSPTSAQRMGTVAHGPHAAKDSLACRHGERFPAFKLHLQFACAQQPPDSCWSCHVNICNCLAAAGWRQLPSPCHDGAALSAGQVPNGNRPPAGCCSSAPRTETTPIDDSIAPRQCIDD